ncbi:DUF4221 family protein [Bacteroides intestinalis]|uniref:DUF4221 domain-containing protein n=1 Tax=Bacteroides intestinalis TaxID=329854 RepID=A0A414LE96_9BACE|nr:DUF4221 family protein [Bacteroides intestinalis]RHE92951.1 DUF4221 domain-containing protein [Bacteroides intestinalis]
MLLVIAADRMKVSFYMIISICLLLVSCSGNKKQTMQKSMHEIKLDIEEVLCPVSEVLNLKSYHLSSAFHNDSLNLLYGYNYKSHALDCIDMLHHTISEIVLSDQGESAIMHRVCGLFVQAPDSIWLYDDTQRIFLLNSVGQVLKVINLQNELKEGEQVLINSNHAMSTARLYYDKGHNSLLYGVKDFSSSPISFKVRETFLSDTISSMDYPLQASVVIPDVGEGDYANMSDPNINFTEQKIMYNYPVESHIYVMDRDSKKTEVINADSRNTKNVAGKCESKQDYSKWERHGIENPHFYDVMYLPVSDMYARLHLGEEEFDATRDLLELESSRSLYLTLFDKDFILMDEKKLPSHRYSYFTGWGAISDGIVIYVDNILDKNEKTEELAFDIIRLKQNKE